MVSNSNFHWKVKGPRYSAAGTRPKRAALAADRQLARIRQSQLVSAPRLNDHPGKRLDSGCTRLPTGKSSTTSEPSPHHPRARSAHAAVMTDDRGMFHSWYNCWTRRRTTGSSRTGPEGRPVRITLTRGFGQPIIRPAFRWKVPSPVDLFFEIIVCASYSDSQSIKSCNEPKMEGGIGASEAIAQ